MAQLFAVPKVGMVLDTITHASEKRRDAEVKVVTLACRVQPFDRALAGCVREDVRATLFMRTVRGDPYRHLERVAFRLGLPRQHLTIFASPDTVDPSLRLTQVKISGVAVRVPQEIAGVALVFRATFGPASADELAYIEAWRGTERFVTCEEAELSLAFLEREAEEDDEDEPAEAQPPLPPMWDDQEPG